MAVNFTKCGCQGPEAGGGDEGGDEGGEEGGDEGGGEGGGEGGEDFLSFTCVRAGRSRT